MVSLLSAARDLARVRDIARVLVRHGFGEIVYRTGLGRKKGKEKDPELDAELSEEEQKGAAEAKQMSSAVRARRVLEDLGPSFVKLGQIISTRTDILPADLVRELKKLQDSVPPVPFDDIKRQVEHSLGAPIEEVFETFDPEPLAAASIAQVHCATLKTDDGVVKVAVKVQRPGIGDTVKSDVDILHGLAALVERTIPESKIYSPVGLVQQFDRAITSELDFSTEAENAIRFAENFEGYKQVKFPKVYKQASSKQVLTLEFLDGQKIYDAMENGHDGKKLARIAVDIVVKQIFEDGFFHADPHPGNVFVMGTPERPIFAMIDLGMVGRLSPRMRDLTVDLMVAAVRKDYEGIADALYAIGTKTKKVDMNAYRAEVSLLAEKYLGKQLKDIEISELIRDLVQGATKYGLEIPPDFMLVGKALMTIEGVGKEIDPELDVFNEVKPLFLEILRKRYSPERIGNELLRRVERLSGATYNVPQQLSELLDDVALGRLVVKTEALQSGAITDRLGRRISSGIVSSALMLSGAWLVAAEHHWLGGILMALAVGLYLLHVSLDTLRGLRKK